MTGFALLFGYGLLGAGWLILKTEGAVQAAARRHGRVCLVGVLVGIGVVSIWTPFMSQAIAARWFAWPNILYSGAGACRDRGRRLLHLAGTGQRK